MALSHKQLIRYQNSKVAVKVKKEAALLSLSGAEVS